MDALLEADRACADSPTPSKPPSKPPPPSKKPAPPSTPQLVPRGSPVAAADKTVPSERLTPHRRALQAAQASQSIAEVKLDAEKETRAVRAAERAAERAATGAAELQRDAAAKLMPTRRAARVERLAAREHKLRLLLDDASRARLTWTAPAVAPTRTLDGSSESFPASAQLLDQTKVRHCEPLVALPVVTRGPLDSSREWRPSSAAGASSTSTVHTASSRTRPCSARPRHASSSTGAASSSSTRAAPSRTPCSSTLAVASSPSAWPTYPSPAPEGVDRIASPPMASSAALNGHVAESKTWEPAAVQHVSPLVGDGSYRCHLDHPDGHCPYLIRPRRSTFR